MIDISDNDRIAVQNDNAAVLAERERGQLRKRAAHPWACPYGRERRRAHESRWRHMHAVRSDRGLHVDVAFAANKQTNR